MNLDEIISLAKEKKSYFITISVRDKEKTEGDLTHYTFRNEFEIQDIMPSLDAAIDSMNIKLPKPVDVIIPPKLKEYSKLKIMILSHFHMMPASFSPARQTKEMIKMLKDRGHEVILLAQESSVLDIGCEVRAVLPRFKMEKNIVNVEMKERMIKVLQEQLPEADCVISQDFFIDSLMTYREALRDCGVQKPFLHFCRSGISRPIDFKMNSTSKYIYLNYEGVGAFAKKIGVDSSQCRTIFNPKDPCRMFNFDPMVIKIINKYRLWERDVIQIFPCCSTRLASKNVDSIIRLFVELKRLGKRTMLIIANSNGKKKVEELKRYCEMAKNMGLNEDEFTFTSLEDESMAAEAQNIVCAQLMQISNVFAMGSVSEVGPNVWLESALSKCLLIANSDLPLLYDFVDKNKVLSYPFSSNRSLNFSGRIDENMQSLAKQIITELDNNKPDLAFRQVWKNNCSDSIYNILMDVIMEAINDFKKEVIPT
jgi:hypothetical protein